MELHYFFYLTHLLSTLPDVWGLVKIKDSVSDLNDLADSRFFHEVHLT